MEQTQESKEVDFLKEEIAKLKADQMYVFLTWHFDVDFDDSFGVLISQAALGQGSYWHEHERTAAPRRETKWRIIFCEGKKGINFSLPCQFCVS